MIKIAYKDGNNLVRDVFSEKHFSVIKSNKLVWLDVKSKGDPNLKKIFGYLNVKNYEENEGELGIDDHISFVFRYLTKEYKFEKMNFIFGENFVITMSSGKSTDEVYKENTTKRFVSPLQLICDILDDVMIEYNNYLEMVEDDIDVIEEKAVKSESKGILPKVFDVRKKLTEFSKIVWKEKGIISGLKTRNLGVTCISEREEEIYNELEDDAEKLISLTEGYKNNVTDAVSAYHSNVSLKSNQIISKLTTVMLILTVVSTVAVFPNTIATMFGIPKISDIVEEEVIVISIIASTAIPLLILWKKKWLKF